MNQAESLNWIKENCGEGWLPLVKKLFSTLPEGTTVTSIYQKWGALMFEATPWSHKVEKIHDDIESISLQTCEICGELGKETNIDSWIHTRCENHKN